MQMYPVDSIYYPDPGSGLLVKRWNCPLETSTQVSNHSIQVLRDLGSGWFVVKVEWGSSVEFFLVDVLIDVDAFIADAENLCLPLRAYLRWSVVGYQDSCVKFLVDTHNKQFGASQSIR